MSNRDNNLETINLPEDGVVLGPPGFSAKEGLETINLPEDGIVSGPPGFSSKEEVDINNIV